MARKTALEIFQLMCPTINLAKPQVVFSSTDSSIVKLTALLHETLDDLLREHDWQFLRREYTVTTTAGVESYPFPEDIDRFLSGTFYDRTNRWELPGSLTPSQWQNLKAWQSGHPFQKFTVANNQIKFYPTPGNAITFVCEYIANVVANSSGGIEKSVVDADSDVIVFDHRLVTSLLKLKWLTSFGLDTTSAVDDFNDTLAAIKAQETPKQIINAAGSSCQSPYISMANFPFYSPGT